MQEWVEQASMEEVGELLRKRFAKGSLCVMAVLENFSFVVLDEVRC